VKKIIFTIVFLLLSASAVGAMQGIECLFHVHTLGWSDGHSTVEEVAEYAKKPCIEYSDHGDSFKKPDDFLPYRNQIEKQDKDGIFTALAGVEVTVGNAPGGKNDCHGNEIPDLTIDHPYLYDSKYSKNQVLDVIDTIHKQGGLFVFNHPRTCPEWNKIAENFDGIEVFNEYMGVKDFNLYVEMMKKGWKGFVIGGTDLHRKEQVNQGIATFVFSPQNTPSLIREALGDGNTIATVGIRSINVNPIPAKQPYLLGEDGFAIDMEIKTEMLVPISLPPCQIYRDGIAYKKINTIKGNSPGLREIHFFSDKPGCYAMVIPGIMVTSQFCFEKEEKGPQPLPNKAWRITKVTTDQMFYITEKEGLEHPYPFHAFEYCYEDFAVTEDGFVFGCKNPLIIKDVKDGEEFGVLYYAPELYKSTNNEENIQKVERSYAVALGENEYKCVTDHVEYCIIITGNGSVAAGNEFYVCNPDGPILYNKENGAVSCNKTCEGEASHIWINDHWAFSPKSGDCPVIRSGSIWIVPKKD